MTTLARLVDPDALDQGAGTRALLSIEVPESWLEERAAIAIEAPLRLACARCDGGGCDSCERRGAFRAPEPAEARTFQVTLPQIDGAAFALRVVQPFGEAAAPEQLILRVRVAETPSRGITRIELPADIEPPDVGEREEPRRKPSNKLWLLFVVIALIGAGLEAVGRFR